MKWAKCWSFSFSINPSNEYSGLICFKIDWFDLLAVQRTFRSLLQHHSSKTWILWCSAFFNSPVLTTVRDHWENHSGLLSLLFNKFQHIIYVCHCFPAKKQASSDFTAAVTICSDFGAKKRKSVTTSTSSLLFAMKYGARGHDLSFLNSLKPALSLSSFTLIERFFSSPFTFCH